MIKLGNEIPAYVPDGSNPAELQTYLTQMKLVVEELARKAQSLQMEERTTAPAVDDLEMLELVHVLAGGLRYIYTKETDGTIHWIAVT